MYLFQVYFMIHIVFCGIPTPGYVPVFMMHRTVWCVIGTAVLSYQCCHIRLRPTSWRKFESTYLLGENVSVGFTIFELCMFYACFAHDLCMIVYMLAFVMPSI